MRHGTITCIQSELDVPYFASTLLPSATHVAIGVDGTVGTNPGSVR